MLSNFKMWFDSWSHLTEFLKPVFRVNCITHSINGWVQQKLLKVVLHLTCHEHNILLQKQPHEQ